MDLHNFPVTAFHPNTLQKLIEERDSLLQEDFKDYFPLFALFGFLENDDFSSDLKSDLKKITGCEINVYFEYEGVLFFLGENIFKKEKKYFIVPFAVKKENGDKSLSSVFKNSKAFFVDSAYKKLKKDGSLKSKLKISELKNKISYRSFKIAGCRLLKNEYSLFDEFWVKVNS